MAARKRVTPPEVWEPCLDYTKAEVIATKAMAEGNADSNQQKLFLDFVINKLCKNYDQPYRPKDTDTAYACGRMQPAKEIVKFINVPITTWFPGTKTKPKINDARQI